jgi:Integrase core domain
MGDRHHLHRSRPPLPGGRHGLGEPGSGRLSETVGMVFRVAALSRDSRATQRIEVPDRIGDSCFGRPSVGQPAESCLEETLLHFGKPQIFNTDEGSQFTGMLERAGIISMDGRGRWMDNVFIERLWRSLKHEDVHLQGLCRWSRAARGLADWIAFYNNHHPH